VLSVVEEPTTEPGPGQARIAVRAAGVNPVDYKSYSGAFGTDPARLPVRPGSEAAGVVTAVGPDAAGPAGPVAVGDEVIAFRAPGAYATELVTPAAALVPKPAALDWAQAAGLMLTGVTAWHTLAATDVHEGDTVLIHGGAGGVGLMAVQLATGRGAIPVVTASPASTASCAILARCRWRTGPAWAGGSAPRCPAGSTPRWT
jgi:NADPH:quinone reductase-like Zn-dependent oxidoreductase